MEDMEFLVKKLLEAVQPIEFGMGGVPMEVAEKVLGMKRSTIIDHMEDGSLDIGTVFPATKKRGVRGYRSTYISPKKFYEYTGYVWKERAVQQ